MPHIGIRNDWSFKDQEQDFPNHNYDICNREQATTFIWVNTTPENSDIQTIELTMTTRKDLGLFAWTKSDWEDHYQ